MAMLHFFTTSPHTHMPENQKFYDVFKGYRNGIFAWNKFKKLQMVKRLHRHIISWQIPEKAWKKIAWPICLQFSYNAKLLGPIVFLTTLNCQQKNVLEAFTLFFEVSQVLLGRKLKLVHVEMKILQLPVIENKSSPLFKMGWCLQKRAIKGCIWEKKFNKKDGLKKKGEIQ